MLDDFFRTLVKVTVASLIVGAVLAHFGATPERVMTAFRLSPERLAQIAQDALNWAWPHLMLGALVVVPVWFVVFLFRPPRARSE
jgi:hypothetical protein